MKRSMTVRSILMIFGLLLSGVLHAQTLTVRGVIIDDADGSALPGVTILEKGTTNGTASGVDGGFTLTVNSGAVLEVSFIGYTTQEISVGNRTTINIRMVADVLKLDEVIVIGYGTVKKSDLTGSVASVSASGFNKGAITSPQELLTGKIAGVYITNNGGAPGAGATIRIRGGSSLSASNDPLIVIDGVPVEGGGISGMSNPLGTIHPGDIESFTVLKDASATAIYGSRASNGVIIITTKKGASGKPLAFAYNGYASMAMPGRPFEVFTGDEFRDLINTRFAGNTAVTNLLGTENTNWQEEIFRNAISHDHNVSMSGEVLNMLPLRVSVGYTNEQGILETSSMERFTGSLNLSPSFLNDNLKIVLNAKGMMINNQFANQGAIGSAISFDPTQPIKQTNNFGGYFTWVDAGGAPNKLASANPLAQLYLRDDISDVKRVLGNFMVDYTMPFMPQLRANLNLGYDYSDGRGTIDVPDYASWSYDPVNGGGEKRVYDQFKSNELLDFYLNYSNDYGAPGRVDFTAGYSWQHFWRMGSSYATNVAGTQELEDTDYKSESYLVSFFGRMNYILKDRYYLTATLRQDGSSKLSPENRWGLFPSVALAWDLAKEDFFPAADVFNTLKLRLGYGITGQQATGGDYDYLPRYTSSDQFAQYQFGTGFIPTIRPEGYDSNLKWEETTTYNIALDYGMWQNRVYGSVEVYKRDTKDLLNFIPVPAGTNLTNAITTNVGDMTNKGVEFSINGALISQPEMKWEIGFNASFNKNEITKLTLVDDPDYLGVFVGGISGAVGNTIQIHSVGHPRNSFYVYEQVYDNKGNPIEGLYVDRNRDGQITVDDKYIYEKPAPDVTLGINTGFTYRNWDFTMSGRANFGNYVYNNMFSNTATYQALYQSTGYLNNQSTNLLDNKFVAPQYWSDHFIENASFFRMDNITLGYNFMNIMGKANLRVYGTAQNVFVITDYQGMDPEVYSGIGSTMYPRPRVFTVGARLGF